MSRRAQPWYRRGKRMWYTQIDGHQHPLGVRDPDDEAGARAALDQLVERLSAAVAAKLHQPPPVTSPSVATDGLNPVTVGDAAVGFLAHHERRAIAGKIDPRSVRNYRLTLAHLGAAFGGRPVGSLTAEELEAWADRPGWSASYQNTTLGTVQQLLRWAGVALKVKRPPKESRGADTCLSDQQFAAVLAAVKKYRGAKGDLCDLLRVLRETGARPAEIANLTAELVDWDNACTRLRKHKTKKKTGQDRIIHFPAAGMRILEAQRARYGTGPLFRTRAGKPYQPNVIVKRLLDVSEVVGFRVTAYGLGRHSFCDRALAAGIPDVVVAGLMGHRGTGMIHRHYSHIDQNSRLLKAAAEQVSNLARKDAS